MRACALESCHRSKRNVTFQATLPGIVQYKRPALEKSGVPVYQPSATAAAAAAYQQAALALQMQQQFVPVSCKYKVNFHFLFTSIRERSFSFVPNNHSLTDNE